jgi:hypothetical protein
MIYELRGDTGAIRLVLTPPFRKPRSSPPQKRTNQPGDAFEDTAFKQGFEIVKFSNQVVESQLFTSLRYIYPQWLSDIELSHGSAFAALYSKINPCFTAGNRTGV